MYADMWQSVYISFPRGRGVGPTTYIYASRVETVNTYRGLCKGRDLTGRGVQPTLGDYYPAYSSVSKQHAVR